MIGKLTGLVDSITGNQVILDVHGVGYVVSAANRTLQSLTIGQTAALLIETQVREDAITLFGFSDALERHWFRLLTSVQGVGPKVGLALLSVMTPQDITLAIAAKDKVALTRADGVGGKLAERLLTELKDKAGDMPTVTQIGLAKHAHVPPSQDEDALLALIGLGYARAEAYTAIGRVRALHPDLALPQIITAALKDLAA